MTVEQQRTLLRWKKTLDQVCYTSNQISRQKKISPEIQKALLAFAKAAEELAAEIEQFVESDRKEEID